MIIESVSEIYLIFDGSSTRHRSLRTCFVIFINLVILVSLVSSYIETSPDNRYQPNHCDHPVCKDDPDLCPGKMVCESEPHKIFYQIEYYCIFIFIIEYVGKFLTLWAVPVRRAKVMSSEIYRSNIEKYESMNVIELYFRWIFCFRNIIDAAIILLYFIVNHGLLDRRKFPLKLFFIKTIRLLRLRKVFHTNLKIYGNVLLVITSLRKSAVAMGVLIMISMTLILFYGSIMYLIGHGDFKVTEEYPEGEYFIDSSDGYSQIVSPFRSIPTCMYWVITTLTTVGYGDLVPVNWHTRFLAVTLMYIGIILLSFPIGVLSADFIELLLEIAPGEEHDEELIENLKSDMNRQNNDITFNLDDNRATEIVVTHDVEDCDARSVHNSDFKHDSKVTGIQDNKSDDSCVELNHANIDKIFDDNSSQASQGLKTSESQVNRGNRDKKTMKTKFQHAKEAVVALYQLQDNIDDSVSALNRKILAVLNENR